MGETKGSRTNGSNGFAPWTGLYVSGILLLLFVGAHIWAVHYAGDVTAEGFTFSSVSARIESPLYSFSILGLLIAGLFHGLTGLHRFIVDLGICGHRARRASGAVITAVGVLGLFYGLLIFRAFLP
jgi:succinate dehydrogenase hydrophobic anchor subunit